MSCMFVLGTEKKPDKEDEGGVAMTCSRNCKGEGPHVVHMCGGSHPKRLLLTSKSTKGSRPVIMRLQCYVCWMRWMQH